MCRAENAAEDESHNYQHHEALSRVGADMVGGKRERGKNDAGDDPECPVKAQEEPAEDKERLPEHAHVHEQLGYDCRS